MQASGRVKPLILVVDIDDDVSEVLGVSVIAGYDRVREAALEFGLKRPEDADVNAMLAGLRLYNTLRDQGLEPEIAVVGGHRVDMIAAQRNVKQAVARLVESIGSPVEFYIVSDGEDEFTVSQLLHEYGRIGGFYRVIVEQHLGIEGGYLLILKYLKKAAEDPRYSKYVVGIPGIALLLIGVLTIWNIAYLALQATLILIGAVMIVRGFDLEGRLYNLALSIWERPYFYIAGSLVFIILFTSSAYSAYQSYVGKGLSPGFISDLSKTSIPLVGAAVFSYILISRVFPKASRGDLNLFHEASAMVVTAAVSLAFYNMGVYLSTTGTLHEIVLDAFLNSDFLQYIIIGSGIAALIELAKRVTYRGKAEDDSTSHNS